MNKLKIAILVILVLIAAVAIRPICCGPMHKEQKLVETRIDIDALAKAIHFFFQTSGNLPTNELGLNSLILPHSDTIKRVPLDRWGEQFKYQKISENRFYIISLGSARYSKKLVVRAYSVDADTIVPIYNFDM